MTAPAEAQPQTTNTPPYDQGNELLADTGAQMTCTVMTTSLGQRLVVTTRTPSTTLTVFLTKESAESWSRLLADASRNLSGLIVPGTATLA